MIFQRLKRKKRAQMDAFSPNAEGMFKQLAEE
jgi:hypothetical protein